MYRVCLKAISLDRDVLKYVVVKHKNIHCFILMRLLKTVV